MSKNTAEFPMELLRAAYGESAGCPSPESFLADSLACMPAERRQEIEAHAETCPACWPERQLARAFDEAGDIDESSAADVAYGALKMRQPIPIDSRRRARPRPGDQPSHRPRWTALVGLAAVLLLGIALAPLLELTFNQAPEVRGPETGRAVRSARIEGVDPLGDVTIAPRRFDWLDVSGAARYRVTLRRVDGSILWETQTTQSFVELPAAIREALAPAVAYTWEVSAWDANEGRVAWSERMRFRLAPSAQGATE